MWGFKKNIYQGKSEEIIPVSCPDITIGTQIWTGCNLDVTTYRNGDPIPEVTDPSAWVGLTTGAWCYYNNDSANGPIYGKLYNWYAVNDPRGLAPLGYHIPTYTEFNTLITYLGGISNAGGALKEAGTAHWLAPNTGATNSSGFTYLPAGGRNASGLFLAINTNGYIISATEFDATMSYAISVSYTSQTIGLQAYLKNIGFSVRLVKD